MWLVGDQDAIVLDDNLKIVLYSTATKMLSSGLQYSIGVKISKLKYTID